MEQLTIEVLAKGAGYTVVRLAGRRFPMLLLHPDVVRKLNSTADAAALRAKAGDNAADAITDFRSSLKALMVAFEAEAEKVATLVDEMAKTDSTRALREIDEELAALRQLRTDDPGNGA